MISWMQKHNKYLVWTIWIATIAFIGAGFVGWGSYDMSSKASSVAKVGEIEIKQVKLNMAYNNIYNQYNEAMQGTLDDKKAKEMGLVKQAFSQVETQAKLLNFSKEMGIVVSTAEIAKKLQEIPAFQKEGHFDKEIYDAYLKSKRIKAKVFETTLEEDILIQKTFDLLTVDAFGLEKEAIISAMNISDKIAYTILTLNDVTIEKDENQTKSYWEMQKENYMTPQMYALSIVWTESNNTVVTDEEIKAYYEANSFNYSNAEGKQLSFAEAKVQATQDLKVKMSKKTAQKAYIAFKKNQLESSEKVTLPAGDSQLSDEIWDTLKDKSVGDILKPKVVGERYATIKVESITIPRVKTYQEAYAQVTSEYENQAKQKALLSLSETKLKEFNQTDALISDFLRLDENVSLPPLTQNESFEFVKKLFTSSKEKGIISVKDTLVIYTILEQKVSITDNNMTQAVERTVNKLKQNSFETNLIKVLDEKYPTELYRGGLTN